MKRQKPRRDDYEYSYRRLGEKYSDGSSDDEVELDQKNKKTYYEPPTVEKVVEEGDTLQSLAIRYGCSVAELKRLNHILNDNEIYAKGVVKVPDRPFSAILAGVHSSGRSSPNVSKKNDTLELLESKLNNTLLSPSGTSKSENFNEVIFNSTISNKPQSINEIELEYTQIDEEVTLLPGGTAVETNPVKSKYTCSGADADISWVTVLIFGIIVIIAVPLIFGFYFYEHPDHYHHIHKNHTILVHKSNESMI